MPTYYVDTNYFLRLLLKDNPEQFQMAYDLFESALKGNVYLTASVIVFFEIYWVLSSFYKRQKTELIPLLKQLLSLKGLEFQSHTVPEDAIDLFATESIALEDCVHIFNVLQDEVSLVSFDQKLLNVWKKLDTWYRLLKIKKRSSLKRCTPVEN